MGYFVAATRVRIPPPELLCQHDLQSCVRRCYPFRVLPYFKIKSGVVGKRSFVSQVRVPPSQDVAQLVEQKPKKPSFFADHPEEY